MARVPLLKVARGSLRKATSSPSIPGALLVENGHCQCISASILAPDDYDRWLAGDDGELLKPYPADEITAYHVSRTVNNPKNDTPECIEALS